MIITSKNSNTPLIGNQQSVSPSPVNISNLDGLAVETLKHQMKTEQKLEALEQKLDQIAGRNIPINTPVTPDSPPISTPATPSDTKTIAKPIEENIPKEPVLIPISAKFLAKVLPTIEPTKVENAGIFGLRTFDNLPYTTYQDAKFGMTVVASMIPYEAFLKNFQAIDNKVYTVNETKTFPFSSFFVNPAKSDSSVRIVMKVESQTLLVTLPKSKFNTLKSLILKK